jgi:hypothetical protein
MLQTDHSIGFRGRARRHRDGVTRWRQFNGDVVTAVAATPRAVGSFTLAGIPLGFVGTRVAD